MADPLWINVDAGAPAYTADELRRAMAALLSQAGTGTRFGARSGLHPASGNAVTLAGSTITVNNLKGVVHPALTSTAGPYIVQLPSHTHTLTAAAANPRKDIVVLRIYDDDEDSSGQRTAVTEYIAGTPAASPSEPSVPSGAIRIATIDVPASGGGSATVTNNYPIAVAAGGVEVVRTDAELLGTAGGVYDGMLRWNQATDTLEVHDGASTWETLAGAGILAPGTVVAHLQRTSAQSLTNSTASSTADVISWDTEVLDRLACWSSGSNPTRYTPNVPGWYMFYGMVSFAAETTGTIRACAWKKNGSPIDGNVYRGIVDETPISNQGTTSMAIPFPMLMNGTTDYVELAGMHDASAALNTGTSGFRCSFTAVYAGPN